MTTLALSLLAACSDYELKEADDAVAETGLGEHEPAETGEAAVPSCEDHEPPTPGAVSTDALCQEEVPPGTFTPVAEWELVVPESYASYDSSMATPAVTQLTDDDGDGDIDADDTPDILVITYPGSGYRGTASVLRALDGATGAERWSLLGTLGAINGTSGIGVGDVEGDGDVEIFVCTVGHDLLAVDHLGHELWLAEGVCESGEDNPSLHDLDADGTAEIVVGRSWVDMDGNLIASGAYGRGGVSAYGSSSFAADVDGDGMLEIVTGNAVYERDGTALWTSGEPDGHPAIADFEGDGIPDLVVTASGTMYRYEADSGVIVWELPFTGGAYGGAPTIADFDGDGVGEFGVAGLNFYTVYEADGSELWQTPTSEGSIAITGSSVFDFEGDGAAEVVYADHYSLWVFNGADGSVKLQWDDHASGTVSEYPLVADVDGDDQAEIVTVSNDLGEAQVYGLAVIGDADDSWVDAGRAWNQHAFHISHVEDSGAVPASYAPSWQTHNSFRAGRTEGLPTYGRADLVAGPPEICLETCELDEITVWLSVENQGLADVTAVPVAVRRGDGSALLTELVDLASGTSAWVGPLTLRNDDVGLSLSWTVDPDEAFEECDEDNNVQVLVWPCP